MRTGSWLGNAAAVPHARLQPAKGSVAVQAVLCQPERKQDECGAGRLSVIRQSPWEPGRAGSTAPVQGREQELCLKLPHSSRENPRGFPE